MKARLLAAVIVLMIMAGCTTTKQAMTRANEKFAGKNIDEFVLTHGPPYAKHSLNSGDYVYIWRSEIRTYGMPSVTNMSGSTYPGGSFSASGYTVGGGTASVYCEIQIVTDADGNIKSIQPRIDTLGRWTTSRCAEVFR